MSKKIEFFDGDFAVESDSHNWVLISRYKGKTREGDSVVKEKRTFYPTLEKLFKKMLDDSLKMCESVNEIKELLKNFNQKITETSKVIEEKFDEN